MRCLMNIAEYDRAVRAYLARYPIDDLNIISAGKHRKAAFTYNGKRCTVTLATSPSDIAAVQVKLGDIRRLLGPPPDDEPSPREPRTLAAMTAGLKPLGNGHATSSPLPTVVAATEPRTWPCTVSLRDANKCLEFKLALPAADAFGRDAGCRVDFTAPDLFTVRHTDERSRFGRAEPPRIKPDGRLALGATAIMKRIGGPFASTPATATLVGGALQVRLMEAPRARQRLDRETPTDLPDIEPLARPFPAQPTTCIPTVTEDARAALRLIARVERDSDYRLVKTTAAGWEFRVPPIRLEE